jgi:TIR domain-containing protein/SIR2-like protein
MSNLKKLNLIKKGIQRGGIVPVLGNDLSMLMLSKSEITDVDHLMSSMNSAQDFGEQIRINLYDYLAFTLFNSYDLEDPPSPFTLNNVVVEMVKEELAGHDDIKDEIIKIIRTLKTEQLVLEPYRKLINIKGFDTILSVNFDNFLECAFEVEKLENKKSVNSSVDFAIQNTSDDTSNAYDPALQSVFNIMGSISGESFAITDEMSLEYLHKLREGKDKKTKDLFKIIKGKSILLIGCSFPDWFMRFFIRIISNDRLRGEKLKYVACDLTSQDSELINFLESNKTKVIQIEQDSNIKDDDDKVYSNSPEFIDALYHELGQSKAVSTNKPLYKEKIFLSYSWGDKPIVTKMKNEFEKCGVELFFDEDDLRNGERFEDTILNYIENCDYILFLISENSVSRKESYVYSKEWPEALMMERLMKKGSLGNWPEGKESYIRPYIIDNTDPQDPRIPPHFRDNKINITTVPFEDGYEKMVRKFIAENEFNKINT